MRVLYLTTPLSREARARRCVSRLAAQGVFERGLLAEVRPRGRGAAISTDENDSDGPAVDHREYLRNGGRWRPMAANGGQWRPMAADGGQWRPMAANGGQWRPMAV